MVVIWWCVGVSPNTMTLYPNALRVYPNLFIVYPNTMRAAFAQQVGVSPNQFVVIPELVGVSPNLFLQHRPHRTLCRIAGATLLRDHPHPDLVQRPARGAGIEEVGDLGAQLLDRRVDVAAVVSVSVGQPQRDQPCTIG